MLVLKLEPALGYDIGACFMKAAMLAAHLGLHHVEMDQVNGDRWAIFPDFRGVCHTRPLARWAADRGFYTVEPGKAVAA